MTSFSVRCIALAIAVSVTSCSGGTTSNGPNGGSGGNSGSGGSGGGSSIGGSSGTGGSGGGEYVDEQGRCRRDFEAAIFGCPETYDEALAQETFCGVACAGPAGDALLYLRDCTPAIRCAYDREGRELIGGYFGDDVPTHCGETSSSIVAGEFPVEAGVSPLFNELFGDGDPVRENDACRSGRDQCRGAIRLLVCTNDEGQVAGDGTCHECTTDAECEAEYGYAAGEIACSDAGACEFTTGLVGACPDRGTSVCRTADGAFACIDGRCARCTTSEDCVATSPGEFDVCQDGVCLRSELRPL